MEANEGPKRTACRCGTLSDAEEALPSRDAFVAGMVLVDRDPNLWSDEKAA
jgi:hypothetical protein